MHYIQIQISFDPVSFSPVLGLIEIVKGGDILLRYTTVMKCYHVLAYLTGTLV